MSSNPPTAVWPVGGNVVCYDGPCNSIKNALYKLVREVCTMADNSDDRSVREGYLSDAENAAEMARLMVQDRLLTHAMGDPTCGSVQGELHEPRAQDGP